MPLVEPSPRSPLTARREAAIVVASAAVFAALAWFKAVRIPYPVYDDVDFLDIATHVRLAGGPLGLLRDLFTGRFTNANRHPLPLALFSLFARPDPAFHREAQALAVALGVFALLASWWVARRHFGRAAGAVVAVMLSVSGALLWTASRECADALLVAFWALGTGALLDTRGERGALRPWILAGVYGGLAYLTKGPGLFLPICLGIALLSRERLRAVTNPGAWAFAAAFFLTASPLVYRNLSVYHSPFYTLNGRFLWVDGLPDFAEVFAPYADTRIPHGVREYLAVATAGSMAKRFGMGLAETFFHLGDALAFVAPRPGHPFHVAWVVLGVLAALAAVRLLWRSEPGFRRTFMLGQCAWWFCFLVFYCAVAGASRYFLPLVTTAILPPLAVWLADELERKGSIRRSRWLSGLCAAAVLAIASTLLLDPSPTRPPPGFPETEQWIAHNLREGDVYAVDARTYLQPRWLAPQGTQVIVSASWMNRPVPEAEMLRYLCEQHVRYVILDAESETGSIEPGAARARYLFYDRLPREPDGSLPLMGFPSGMRVVYAGEERPRRWVVLETACPGG
jgi:hypothetical protein